MSTFCRNCGGENGDDYRFCAACGVRMPASEGGSTGSHVSPEPAPPAMPEPAGQPSKDDVVPTDPRREMERSDTTLVVLQPVPPTAKAIPPIDASSRAPAGPAERERSEAIPAADDTLIVRLPARPATPTPLPASDPSRGFAAAPPRAARPPTPAFDTGISEDEPVAGQAMISAYESRLLERPMPEARQVGFFRRGDPVGVLRYHGNYAAVRGANGAAGFVLRQALDSQPIAPEHTSPEEALALLPNVARVRAAGAPLRAGPSRLSASVRELHGGEPVQLQTLEAFFARVRTTDGTTGYVERAQIGTVAAARAPTNINIPLSIWAVAATGLLAFFGSLAPWLKACSFCSSTSGVGMNDGWFTLFIAVAGVAVMVAQRWYPAIPGVRFRLAVSVAGILIALIALVDKTDNSDATAQFGLYLTMLAGVGMAVAPWTDELVARARAGSTTP